MYARNQFGTTAIALVVLEEELPRLFVQRRFGVWVDEKAFDGHEDVAYAICGFPVFLKSVNTYFTCA